MHPHCCGPAITTVFIHSATNVTLDITFTSYNTIHIHSHDNETWHEGHKRNSRNFPVNFQ